MPAHSFHGADALLFAGGVYRALSLAGESRSEWRMWYFHFGRAAHCTCAENLGKKMSPLCKTFLFYAAFDISMSYWTIDCEYDFVYWLWKWNIDCVDCSSCKCRLGVTLTSHTHTSVRPSSSLTRTLRPVWRASSLLVARWGVRRRHAWGERLLRALLYPLLVTRIPKADLNKFDY